MGVWWRTLRRTRGVITLADSRKNAEGYSDPTACEAIKNVDRDLDRLQKLLAAIFAVCEAADFHVEERIVLKDKRNGRVWR